ncbi:WW domain-binding protein 1 [Clupea harengus]|uniref:WW domain-binding protein 1 n=1 Tax=Clupea harengus TaxID=7950 RepID=A0A6P3VGN5_CLUHA|nr:WW domain-binding protein 1 [Clupea harengus]
MPQKTLGSIIGLLCTGASVVQAKEFCFGVNNEQYRCEMGYCCGETECCTYYYELWWFWLVWTLIIMLSCCCAYRHRRVKMRLQQEQRQREISLMAYQGASSSFVSPPPLNLRFWTDCKLPDYEEVVGHPPTPPPPYSEMPPETSPPGQAAAAAAIVLEPPIEQAATLSRDEQGSAAAAVVAGAAASAGLSNHQQHEVSEEEEPGAMLEEEEELGTRRRHVTGDSGIEVCICQMDVDEGSCGEEDGGGGEERGECEQLCQGGTGGACCAEREAVARHKEHSPEPRTGDRLV